MTRLLHLPYVILSGDTPYQCKSILTRHSYGSPEVVQGEERGRQRQRRPVSYGRGYGQTQTVPSPLLPVFSRPQMEKGALQDSGRVLRRQEKLLPHLPSERLYG